MSDYKIVCTEQTPVNRPTKHAHITAVGVDTNNDNSANEKHQLNKVVDAIDSRLDRYYSYGKISGVLAWVETIDCPVHCGERIIRSTPDTNVDNNLDSLRRCAWS